VGRSLGTLVGEQVIARHGLHGYEAADFGAICAAACLAHDIGNPPFGHAGEDGFRHWAEHAPYGRQRVAVLSDSEREDFLAFEGNAQGFRVLTRLQNRDNPGGLQLTCATLATFTKYPGNPGSAAAVTPAPAPRSTASPPRTGNTSNR
jgi:dGTPase